MRKLIVISIVLASVILLSSCGKKPAANKVSMLEKSWTQSSEEKTTDEIEIYRPSNYKDFPPSRYRQIFNFKDNNVCEYLVLSENDAHFMETGNWEYDDNTKTIKISNSDSIMMYEFEIVELTAMILKLKTKN